MGWGRKHFVVISLVVTTVSIIFLFAFVRFFPRLKVEGDSWRKTLTQSVAPWIDNMAVRGGLTIKAIRLHFSNESDSVSKEEQLLRDRWMAELGKDLNALEGQSLWSLNLGQLKQKILKRSWISEVGVRRSLSGELHILVATRQPALLVKGYRSWFAVDDQGILVLAQNSVPGWLSHLPYVIGLESELPLESQPADFDLLPRTSETLQKVVQLKSDLEERLSVSVMGVGLTVDPWSEDYISEWVWKDKKDREMKATLLLQRGVDRLPSVQWVLSDLMAQESESSFRILGHLESQIVVQGGR
jgi:hypothetical protein